MYGAKGYIRLPQTRAKVFGKISRVKRFGMFLLPPAKIIGAELLPGFESWGCSRKSVIFNLSVCHLSCVLYGCFLFAAFRNPSPIHYTLFRFTIRNERGKVEYFLLHLRNI
jgi:hypothetical protein